MKTIYLCLIINISKEKLLRKGKSNIKRDKKKKKAVFRLRFLAIRPIGIEK